MLSPGAFLRRGEAAHSIEALRRAVETIRFSRRLRPLLPEALEAGVPCLDSHLKYVFVVGNIKFIAHDGSPLLNLNKRRVGEDYYLNLLRHNYITTIGMVMFRRAIFDSLIGFEPSLVTSDDWDLYLRIPKNPLYMILVR